MEYRQEAVRIRAYHIWEREGCPEGRQLEHWMRAERELAHLVIEHGEAGAISTDAPQGQDKPSKPARRKQAAATAKADRGSKAKAKPKAKIKESA